MTYQDAFKLPRTKQVVVSQETRVPVSNFIGSYVSTAYESSMTYERDEPVKPCLSLGNYQDHSMKAQN